VTDPIRLAASIADRYTIDREIGRGGMATVYLARDVKHSRPVALKILDPDLGAVLGVERFLAEIRVTANLQHPNLRRSSILTPPESARRRGLSTAWACPE
jgi:serine/threonine protein kinase